MTLSDAFWSLAAGWIVYDIISSAVQVVNDKRAYNQLYREMEQRRSHAPTTDPPKPIKIGDIANLHADEIAAINKLVAAQKIAKHIDATDPPKPTGPIANPDRQRS